VKVTRDGKYVYATNRGHDSIAAYKVGDDGRLELVAIERAWGRGRRTWRCRRTGRGWSARNMPGNNVTVFRIDPRTGRLTPAGEPLAHPSPSCIAVLP